ncbi:succinate dehydrogenase assembly factor 2 [Roseomonas sp. NAR14]|uniref:FAD assembly factor SdhE n=1 Tax=Roseomonas acroporae TaxID=2937791 RepID=A0A9X2BRR4_9PROT|nr:succinate dehydrogenase assembly factor 2 [Roseomonas acroporae]MCK8782863.1 succinate dehydrogenase assembly factor 2 [Roseomonas acroporae]
MQHDQKTDPTAPDIRRRRLLFRARHRGTKEADLVLGGFVERNLPAFTEAELAALEALLDLPDVDLADWFSGRRPVPPEQATPMLLRIVGETLGRPPGGGLPGGGLPVRSSGGASAEGSPDGGRDPSPAGRDGMPR